MSCSALSNHLRRSDPLLPLETAERGEVEEKKEAGRDRQCDSLRSFDRFDRSFLLRIPLSLDRSLETRLKQVYRGFSCPPFFFPFLTKVLRWNDKRYENKISGYIGWKIYSVQGACSFDGWYVSLTSSWLNIIDIRMYILDGYIHIYMYHHPHFHSSLFYFILFYFFLPCARAKRDNVGTI